MSSTALEAFLALLYVDGEARARFRVNPRREAERAGLTDEESAAVMKIDLIELEMTARSFAAKRKSKAKQRRRLSFMSRVRTFLAMD
ncbi:MAG: hypothetical protein ABSG16_08970 [Candidatus Acidiferrum sp.]|jgi:hypothetical protein